MNKLFVIATPIGNLKEANQLLIQTLENVDILFCEDTRVSTNLLKLLNIKNHPKLISYHKFNEHQKLNECMDLIYKNKCGLISDAGYPSISDPGFNLIKECHHNNIKIEVINGTSSVMHAITQSGLCSSGFVFIGFVDKNKSQIIKQLNHALSINLPVVFFESVHRINQLIELLKNEFSDHLVYIGRELTKKFETYTLSKASELVAQVEKGEFCLVINPLNANAISQYNIKQVMDEIKELTDIYNMRLKDACKYIAKKYQLDPSNLYKTIIK